MRRASAMASLLTLAVLILSGCASLHKDWTHASNKDNAFVYRVFLQKHPNSKYTSKAKARIEELDWKQAQTNSTVESFRQFLKKHPDSQYAIKAKAGIDELIWIQAQTKGTLESFRRFLKKHSDSQFASEAKARIVELELKHAQSKGEVWWIRQFLKKHPDSQYENEARAILSSYHKDAWEMATKEDKIYAYKSFMNKFPESEFFSKAKERVRWQRANRAVVQIEYQKTVSSMLAFRWITKFTEKSGKAGFYLGLSYYILDSSGKRWTDNWSRGVSAKPRGSAEFRLWGQGRHLLGYYHLTWIGEDDWGNSIEIKQKVHLVK